MEQAIKQKVNLDETLIIMLIHTIGSVMAFGVMMLIMLMFTGFDRGFESIDSFDTLATNIVIVINLMMPVSLLSSAIVIMTSLNRITHIETDTERDKLSLDLISGINKANGVWILYNILSVLIVVLMYVYGDSYIEQVVFEAVVTAFLWIPTFIATLWLNLVVKKSIIKRTNTESNLDLEDKTTDLKSETVELKSKTVEETENTIEN